MFTTLQWIVSQEKQRGKTFVFGHNEHLKHCLSRLEKKISAEVDVPIANLGTQLKKALKEKFSVIGTTFYEAKDGVNKKMSLADSDTVEALFNKLGASPFLLNFEASVIDKDIPFFFQNEPLTRAENIFVHLNLADAYHSMIYFNSVTLIQGNDVHETSK